MLRPLARELSCNVELPDEITTYNGQLVRTADPEWSWWSVSGQILLPFGRTLVRAPHLIRPCKSTFSFYVQNVSDMTAHNYFHRLMHFFKSSTSVGLDTGGPIDVTDIVAYEASLDAERRWYLAVISIVLRKWHGLGLPGVTDRCVRLLEEKVLPGNRKGESVRTLDPVRGSFSDAELEALHTGLHAGRKEALISHEEYTAALLLMAFGRRPVQLACLKISDLVQARGEPAVLMVPRAKQRELPRSSFKGVPLDSRVAQAVRLQADAARRDLACFVESPEDVPLFPAPRQEWVESWPPGLAYHRTSRSVAQLVTSALRRLSIKSERTGDDLKLNTRRFRHTRGTRMGEEGYSALEIADALDHSDTQNVGIYIAGTPAMLDAIDRATAYRMGPIAQAFRGRIVESEGLAGRGDDPSSRVGAAEQLGCFDPIGTCGDCRSCGLPVPIACYTCPSFQPWLEADHDEVLCWTIERRDREVRRGDRRTAAALERTIYAIAQVAQECRAGLDSRDRTRG